MVYNSENSLQREKVDAMKSSEKWEVVVVDSESAFREGDKVGKALLSALDCDLDKVKRKQNPSVFLKHQNYSLALPARQLHHDFSLANIERAAHQLTSDSEVKSLKQLAQAIKHNNQDLN